MKEKDLTEKALLSCNDVFADVINGTFFNGEEVVKSEELVDTSPVTQFKNDKNELHEQVRDISKLWKKNKVVFSFIGIENQTAVDRDMILRVLSYDAATYKSQVGNDWIYPVFTVVIYWGTNEWKSPTKSLDRLDYPEELKGLISDYRFNLINISRLSDEDIEKYTSDFQAIATFIAKDEFADKDLKHPELVIDLLDAVSDNRFSDIKDTIKGTSEERSTVNMSKLLDKIINESMEKGRKEGIEKGIEKGREEGKFVIAQGMKEKGFTISDIVELTGLTKDKVLML